MYLLGDLPVYAEPLMSRLQEIPAQLLQGLEPSGPALEFSSSTALNSLLPDNQLFIIEQGIIDTSVDQRPLFYLQSGSLIGLQPQRSDQTGAL